MKLTIPRETLLRPLQQVIGVVERRQTLPVLGNVLLEASTNGIRMTATDLEVELRAQVSIEVEETGNVTVPARKFMDICRTLPEEATITISVSGEQRAQIRSGKSRFTLSTLPPGDFPVVEKIKSARRFSISQHDLKGLIERTSFSMAQQDVRYYLNGLMLELADNVVRAVATDGHRLAICEYGAEVGEAGEQQVIVPRKGVQELQRLLEDTEGAVQVEIGTNHIRITAPDLRFTSKLIDGRFPDYQRVIPDGGNKRLVADRDLLRQALTRASILSNEKYRGIRLTITDNILKIQSHNPDQEEAEEELNVDFEGPSIEIGFNVTYLVDALSSMNAEQVEILLSDPNSSCLIQAPGAGHCRYVVMPMRL
jgi:DNA polymerase-3 subunit beta